MACLAFDVLGQAYDKQSPLPQVNEFGQCPRQLFQAPHAPRLACPALSSSGVTLCAAYIITLHMLGYWGLQCCVSAVTYAAEARVLAHERTAVAMPPGAPCFLAPAGVLESAQSAAGSGESSGGDAGERALSLALLATIQAAADAADAEAAEPLQTAVGATWG